MYRTHLKLVGAVIAASLAVAGCSGNGEEGSSGDPLDVYLNMPAGTAQMNVVTELAERFTEETGIGVNLSFDSSNYENNLRVRMASANLPDVWSTHGWSVLRYGQFLEPLNDQPWEEYVDEGLDNSMRDGEGTLYALPIEYTVTGVIANLDVVEEAGIDADSVVTMDDFTQALADVAAIDKIPLVSSGRDDGPAGDLANSLASGAFSDEQLQANLDGEFDQALYQERILDPIGEWAEEGYFNPDYVSASFDDMARQLAQGNAAFGVTQPYLMTAALEFDQQANIGFIPFPSDENGQFLLGGEGVNSFGVWKDSQRKDEALQWLEFLAQPENAKQLAESIGTYSGLTNVEVELGQLQPTYDKWVASGVLETMPFYDRVYLPNGMWSTIVSTTDAVIAQQSTPTEAGQQMATEFATLYGQQ